MRDFYVNFDFRLLSTFIANRGRKSLFDTVNDFFMVKQKLMILFQNYSQLLTKICSLFIILITLPLEFRILLLTVRDNRFAKYL